MSNDMSKKKRLNISGRGYIKENSAGGEVISFVPDVPIKAYLDDILFILTVPSKGQKYAPAYCRLQDKVTDEEKEEQPFSEVRTVGRLIKKQGALIVCAPKERTEVDLAKIVIIATVPQNGKFAAPCYIREKIYQRSRSELQGVSIGEIKGEEKEDDDELGVYDDLDDGDTVMEVLET